MNRSHCEANDSNNQELSPNPSRASKARDGPEDRIRRHTLFEEDDDDYPRSGFSLGKPRHYEAFFRRREPSQMAPREANL